MSPRKRDAKQHAKARHRRRRKTHQRLAHDRRQAQQAAQALEDVGLPTDSATLLRFAMACARPLSLITLL